MNTEEFGPYAQRLNASMRQAVEDTGRIPRCTHALYLEKLTTCVGFSGTR